MSDVRYSQMLATWLRRIAIALALRRPSPATVTLGDKANNCFSIRLGGEHSDYRLLPKKLVTGGVEGLYFAHGERSEACITNAELARVPFSITYFYREFRFVTDRPALFILQWVTYYWFLALWGARANQWLFNHRRIARKDRIAVLRYIFEKTVENPDFRTSCTDLPASMYGMRFYGRPDHDVLLAYYDLLLNSLVESGELRRVDYSVQLAPKALTTLDAHELQEERHNDNRKVQRTIAALTAVLALVAVAQLLAHLIQQ